MDNSSTNKSLIILGNGADLHSGLKTTFTDFMEHNNQASKINNAIESFDSLKEKLKEYTEKEKNNFTDDSVSRKILSFPIYRRLNKNLSFGNFIKSLHLEIDYDKNKKTNFKNINTAWKSFSETINKIKRLTLWEVILILTDGSKDSWYDIEKCMEKFFSMQNIIDKPNKCAQEYIDESMSKLFELNKDNIDLNLIENTVALGNKYEFLIFYILYKRNNKKTDAQSLLFEELISFENKFSEYVYKQVHIEEVDETNGENESSNHKYYENINKLIRTLMKHSKNYSANILNFNYTSASRNTNIIERETNIHGHIQIKENHYVSTKRKTSDIIFGIDSTFDLKKAFNPDNNKDVTRHLIEGEKQIYKFTKTCRKLKKSVNKHINILDDDIDEIIFYGHSLGESDYSYFQSIFDKYRLYDSNLSLIFAFSKLPKKLLDTCIEEQSVSISTLINRYGDTLDNKDHAKNLLHKLLIENRLRLVSLNKRKANKVKRSKNDKSNSTNKANKSKDDKKIYKQKSN